MPPRETIGFDIRTLSILIKRYIDGSATKQYVDNLTGTHGWVIGYLYDNRDHDVYQRDLETQFSIRRSTATGILQLMEKNELILREPVESDARLKKLVLTEKALDIHKMVEEDRKRTEEQLTKDIDAQELAIFRKALKQMIRNMELLGGLQPIRTNANGEE